MVSSKWILQIKQDFRNKRNLNNFFKSIFIFIMQVSLIMVLYMNFNPADWIKEMGVEAFKVDESSHPYFSLLIKFICSLLLHINQQPNVLDCITRLQYVRAHPHKFEKVSIVIIICYMKFIVETLMEIICLYLIACTNNCLDLLLNFIALGCIGEVDEVYYSSIQTPLKEKLMEKHHQIPI